MATRGKGKRSRGVRASLESPFSYTENAIDVHKSEQSAVVDGTVVLVSVGDAYDIEQDTLVGPHPLVSTVEESAIRSNAASTVFISQTTGKLRCNVNSCSYYKKQFLTLIEFVAHYNIEHQGKKITTERMVKLNIYYCSKYVHHLCLLDELCEHKLASTSNDSLSEELNAWSVSLTVIGGDIPVIMLEQYRDYPRVSWISYLHRMS